MTIKKLTALEFAALGEVEATGKMMFLDNRKGGIARMSHILMERGLIDLGAYTAKDGQFFSVTKLGLETLGG